MNKNTATAAIVLVAAVVLSGCGLSETRLSDDTTPVASTSPSEAATPSSEAATPTPQPVATPSPIASVSTSASPEKKEVVGKEAKDASGKLPVKKTPKPVIAATKPNKNNGASEPAKSVIPCGMMDSQTKEMGKCPPPVTPSKIILGESYPWFPVAQGKLAEPWGVAGELLYADDFVTLLKISSSEIVMVSDHFSIRGLMRVIGATSAEVETTKNYTFVKFLCNGVAKTNKLVKHYNNSNIVPASLWVQYKEEINEFEIKC